MVCAQEGAVYQQWDGGWGKPRGDSQSGSDSGLRPASTTSAWLAPTRVIPQPCSVTSLSPGRCVGQTEAEVLILSYSVKLEFENQSVSLLHASHTFFHHQSRNISCDLQTSVVFLAKNKNSFSMNTQTVAVILYASLTSFFMSTTAQNRKLEPDHCKVWQLFPFPCEMGNTLLCLLFYLKYCNFVSCFPNNHQWTIMFRVFH